MALEGSGTGEGSERKSDQENAENQHREHELEAPGADLTGGTVGQDADNQDQAGISLDTRTIIHLIAYVSHELRAPLHSILSFAHLGGRNIERLPRDKLRRYFEDIAASGESLLTIINDLLDLSKLQAGKMQLMLKQGLLDDVMHKLNIELSVLLSERQITMAVKHIGAARPLVFDPSRMLQLLRNLLTNALRHSPEHGHIEVRLDHSRPEAVYIHVLDEGAGIPAGQEELIFDPFFQQGGMVSMGSSTGLGLTICRQIIVQGHQGWIRAANRVAGGAEFIVMLPADLKPTLPVAAIT